MDNSAVCVNCLCRACADQPAASAGIEDESRYCPCTKDIATCKGPYDICLFHTCAEPQS